MADVATPEPVISEVVASPSPQPQGTEQEQVNPTMDIPELKESAQSKDVGVEPPVTPIKGADKPLPKEPTMTPRIKKKVPWKGKNIMILVPRDDQRGLPGMSPLPLRADEIERMFASWEELGYSVDGFDLLVEGYQPPGTDDAQSRMDWPTAEDMAHERSHQSYKVVLPDLNGTFFPAAKYCSTL